MAEVFEAANVREGVEIAERFKEEGRYDWFRGQTQAWPPHSSLFRTYQSGDQARIDRVAKRLQLFFNWIKKCPEMEPICDMRQDANVHAVFAILQHYGIPTHYIDFTTEPGVAGFFAADGRDAAADGKACIYCLNTDELDDVWDAMKELRAPRRLERVTPDVANLWRLQAQHGVFLFCDYNWEVDFPMDRIVFPHSGYPPYPTRDGIYPSHQSPLEVVLDRYFEAESRTFGYAAMHEMLDELRRKGANVQVAEHKEHADDYVAETVKGGELDRLASWDPQRLAPWRVMANQTLREARGAAVSLNVSDTDTARELMERVSYGVTRLLRAEREKRKQVVDWQLTGYRDPAAAASAAQALRRVWNGMRWLPFTDDDLARACGSVVALAKLGFPGANYRSVGDERFAELFGDGFTVEFLTHDGHTSRGYASRASLTSAVRADIREVLNDDAHHRVNDIRMLLLTIYAPMRLFEFDAFVRVFAREIIPTQALMRDEMLFSPAQLRTFGLP